MNCWFGRPSFIEEVVGGKRYYYENNTIEAKSNLYDYVRGWTFLGESV